MEGPFRAPKAIGALSIRSTRAGVENQMPGSRFPAPWSSEEHSGYFVVRGGNGQAMAYIREPDRQTSRQAISRQAAHKRRGAAHCG
jgi:hypothetical protein